MNYLQKELYDQIQSDSKIFEFVQNSSLDGMWYWDLENPEEEWMNDSFWHTLGYDPKEKKHKASEGQDIIDKDDLDLAIGNFKAHCANPSHPYDQVVRYKHKNGSIVWIRCKGLAIRNSEGVPIRMLGAHVDITAQKKSELLLKQKVEKYDLIVEGSSIGTWEWNKETGEFVFNQQFATILGISTKDKIVYSDFLISITHPDDRHNVKTQLDKLTNQSLENLDLEVRIMSKFNTWVWVKIQGHIPLETEYKYTDWIIGTLIDVTKRKDNEISRAKLLKQTQAQNERLMNFTNIVSHNLRSHSSNLLMLLETMLVENPEIKDQEFYNMFKEAATGLSTTISNLHDITNIQTNTDLKKEPIEVNTFVESAISNIKSLASDANVKIINQTIGYLKIHAVPVYLDSILINLLTNAIKYRSLDRDSSVTIKSDVDSEGITISVVDNGVGIDMDQIGEKIFKLHMTTNRDGKSKGIGLFLTKSHVEAMDGWISFSSQVNKGSKFKFFLPHE